MKSKTLKVTMKEAGMRLDVYLSNFEFSRAQSSKLIKDGNIKVDQIQTTKPSYKVTLNQIVECQIPEVKKLDLKPIDINLEIIYEDEDIAVINKPTGISVHPSTTESNPTLVHGLLHSLKSLSSIGGTERPGIVHRLDKGTSGVLLISKNDFSHHNLSQQFKVHSITRKYIALVKGDIKKKARQGTIKTYFGRNPTNRKKMTGKLKSGRTAITHWKFLQSYMENKYSLIECILETGRTHQIRVHLSELGFPIVGDSLYGKNTDDISKRFNLNHQLLHAFYLKFKHPKSNKELEFQTELPSEFKSILTEIN